MSLTCEVCLQPNPQITQNAPWPEFEQQFIMGYTIKSFSEVKEKTIRLDPGTGALKDVVME